MLPLPISRRPRGRVVPAALCLLAFSAVAGAWLPATSREPGRPGAGGAATEAGPRAVLPARDRAGDGLAQSPETELVTVTTTGFDPAEIVRPAGRFILAVENRSGLAEVALVLRDGGGRELLRERVERERLDWSGALDLAPGTYLLGEAEHPEWVCRITLTAP